MGFLFIFHASERDHKGVASGGVMEGLVLDAGNLTVAVDKSNGDSFAFRCQEQAGESSARFLKTDDIEVAISPEEMTTSVRKVAKEEK